MSLLTVASIVLAIFFYIRLFTSDLSQHIFRGEDGTDMMLDLLTIPESTNSSKMQMKRVCYYHIPNEQNSDKTNTSIVLRPEEIDPNICTHIIIAFAKVANENIIPTKLSDHQIYKRVLSLKTQNKHLKIFISIHDSGGGIRKLVKSEKSVSVFCRNARNFLLENGFDGLDVDWEFPAWPRKEANVVERYQFTYFVSELYQHLKHSSSPPLSLSVVVAAPLTVALRSYEIEKIAQNCDFINLMGYDFNLYKPYFPLTGHNAPLYHSSKGQGFFATMNIAWTANFWFRKGTPREKLVVGIPTFGRTWKLLFATWNSLRAPAVGSGMNNGYVSYPEALQFIENGAFRTFDNSSKVPYATMGRNWVSYEDKQSIHEKVSWIKKRQFGGVMTWNLNCDDYKGDVSGRKFDLHHVIKEVLEN